MRSNLQVVSNIMLDDQSHANHDRYIPGDLFALIYPERLDPQYRHQWMTAQQIHEHEQYLVCLLCGRPCAGTCGCRPR